jgi:hypothetical protein
MRQIEETKRLIAVRPILAARSSVLECRLAAMRAELGKLGAE